jgi:large subunit ribosomal protein L22
MQAVHKNMRISPQKARLVADQVRNLHTSRALQILQFSTKKASGLILQVLKSAMANAQHNFGLELSTLRIASICVDDGTRMKRKMPRAKGVAYNILKRMSHVTIHVSGA